MKLTRVKTAIDSRLASSFKVPDIEELQELVYEALQYVAMKVEPKDLLCKNGADDGEKVLRPLDKDFFIKVPEYPDLTHTERHLLVDEFLSYAVINHVCLLVSGDEKFKLFRDEILMLQQQSVYHVEYGED